MANGPNLAHTAAWPQQELITTSFRILLVFSKIQIRKIRNTHHFEDKRQAMIHMKPPLSNLVAIKLIFVIQVVTWHYFRMDHTMWACLSILAITQARKIRKIRATYGWKDNSIIYNFSFLTFGKISKYGGLNVGSSGWYNWNASLKAKFGISHVLE